MFLSKVGDLLRDELFLPGIFWTHQAELLQAFFGKDRGVFVEVGANDPVLFSQTYHLEQIGWTGVLVEPLPDCAERLRRERKARVFEVACSSPENHGKAAKLKVAGVFSTLGPTLMVPGEPILGEVEVRLATLDSLLAEAGIEKVDLLSIDVEGLEIDVLRGIDLEKYGPDLVLLEDHVYDWTKHRYMTAAGYKVVRRTDLNSWYIPAHRPFPISLLGRLQLFRKFVLGVPLRSWRFARRKRRASRRRAGVL
ncbi:MAG: hypothetical protein QOK29_1158 [Rhodospirillaceae bacterium]|jgi:FkbM family methyltransferase|nr:hypothetical protein [Rhodospirillaceae bacterium]